MIRVNDKLLKPFLKSYRNLSLKRKLMLLFYIQVIIPIVFIGYLSYSNAAKAIKNKSFEYSQDILKMIEMRLRTFCQDTDSLSFQLLYDNRIYDYLNENNIYVHDVQYNNIRTTFRDAVLSREGIEGIMLLKDNEQFVSFGNRAGFKADEIIPYDYIYKMALKKSGAMCWITYPYSTSFDDIYGAKIIYSRETFEPIGLMVMIIKKSI